MAENLTTYSSLIEQAIKDFDNVFDRLVEKGVQYDTGDGTLARLLPSDKNNGKFPTSKYERLISSLYKVKGVDAPALVDADSKTNFKGYIPCITTLDSLGGPAISLNDGSTFALESSSSSGTAPGYYNAGIKYSCLNVPLDSIKFEGRESVKGSLNNRITLSDAGTYTILSNSAESLLGKVSLNKGKVTFDLRELTVNNLSGNAPSLENNFESTENKASGDTNSLQWLDKAPDGYLNSNGKLISISATGIFSGGFSIASSGMSFSSLTEGYIESADIGYLQEGDSVVGAEKTFEPKISNASFEKYLYIPYASVKLNHTMNTTVGTGGDSDMIVGTPTNGVETVPINITCTSSVGANSSDLTPGYLYSATQLKDETGKNESTVQIRKGKLPDDKNANLNDDLNIDLSAVTDESSKVTGFKVTASIKPLENTYNYTKTITKGYISDTSWSGNITAEKELNIAKGTVSLNYNPSLSVSNGLITGVISENEITGAESKIISISENGSFGTPAITDGYITTSSDSVSTSKGSASKNIYIKKTSVEHSYSLSVSKPNDKSADIFLDSAPTGEYYTIISSDTISADEGYLEGITKTTTDKKKYLPKAIVEYVEDSTAGNFLTVKNAGFLPSGTISVSGGKIDYANIILASNESDETSGHIISLSKTETTGASGYMTTGENGKISINSEGNNTIAIPYATFNTSLEFTEKNSDTVLTDNIFTLNNNPDTITEGGSTTFKFNGSARVSAMTSTISPGYSKKSSTGEYSSSLLNQEIIGQIILNLPELEMVGGLNISEGTGSNVLTSSENTGFYINLQLQQDDPNQDNSNGFSVRAKYGKNGYIDYDNPVNLEINNGSSSSSKIYIQAGVLDTPTISLSNEIALVGKDETDGGYSISLKGESTKGNYDVETVSITAESKVSKTGYIESTSKPKTMELKTNSLKIPPATISANITGLNASLSQNDSDTDNYFSTAISTTVNDGNSSLKSVPVNQTVSGTGGFSIASSGYASSSNSSYTNSIEGTQSFNSKYYLNVLKNNEYTFTVKNSCTLDVDENGNETGTGFEGVTQSVYSGTKGYINGGNITINIPSDTMGTAVANELTSLRRRMLGLNPNIAIEGS